MAYIGKTPVLGNFVKLDAISVVNGQAAYTMQNGGVNFTSYDNVNQFLVSLNGILQSPTDSFTVSGSTLTFASNLSTGDVIDFVMVLGNTLDVGTPSDNTVSLAKLTATGTKDATTFLRGDNTFAGAGITEADQWRLTANITGTNAVITSNLSQVSGAVVGTGMSESSGIFTFPETGVYLILTRAQFSTIENSDNVFLSVQLTTDNSTYNEIDRPGFSNKMGSNTADGITTTGISFVDITNTSTHKVRFETQSFAGSTSLDGISTKNETTFSFIRLGDT